MISGANIVVYCAVFAVSAAMVVQGTLPTDPAAAIVADSTVEVGVAFDTLGTVGGADSIGLCAIVAIGTAVLVGQTACATAVIAPLLRSYGLLTVCIFTALHAAGTLAIAENIIGILRAIITFRPAVLIVHTGVAVSFVTPSVVLSWEKAD